MQASIATVSLSGDLADKLAAIAAAGFPAVEIFENDFLTFSGGPRTVAAMAADLGLDIVTFQPFRDFEGLPEPLRTRAFDRAERKFDVMQDLGTDLLLVCSNVSPQSLGGIDRAAEDLRALGERAAARGLRIGYEALAWGRHVNDYRDAWEIVRRADHPAVGIILDSFHILSRGLPLAGIQAIPADRIFLVQLADAPQMAMDVLNWSRHFRCMPGQGDLPLEAFMHALSATGYDGVLSLEIFNDQFRAGSPRMVAQDGMRSLLALADRLAMPLPAIRAPQPAALPPRVPCRGVAFLEFAVEEHLADDLTALVSALGFRKAGIHRRKAVSHWTQGDIHLVINTEKEGFAHAFSITHGPAVCAIGLQVDAVNAAMARAQGLRAQVFQQAVAPGEVALPAVRGVGGSLIYFLEPTGDLGAVWDVEFPLRPGAEAAPPSQDAGLLRVDHLSQSMQYDEMLSWQLFYTAIFALDKLAQNEIADPAGLVMSRALQSPPGQPEHEQVRFVLNASQSGRTLSGRFVSEFFGGGVQHVAFATADIVATAQALRRNGLDFLAIPENYYDDIEARYGLDPAFIDRLRAHGLLYERDGDGEYLQLYTRAFAGRFFFEIVERRNYAGFGAGNAQIRLAAQAREAEVFDLLP